MEGCVYWAPDPLLSAEQRAERFRQSLTEEAPVRETAQAIRAEGWPVAEWLGERDQVMHQVCSFTPPSGVMIRGTVKHVRRIEFAPDFNDPGCEMVSIKDAVQRNDYLHAAMSMGEAINRGAPLSAAADARISDIAGIVEGHRYCVPVLMDGGYGSVYGRTPEEAQQRAREYTASHNSGAGFHPMAEAQKPAIKAAINGLTATASGDHRFGRWGAVE